MALSPVRKYAFSPPFGGVLSVFTPGHPFPFFLPNFLQPLTALGFLSPSPRSIVTCLACSGDPPPRFGAVPLWRIFFFFSDLSTSLSRDDKGSSSSRIHFFFFGGNNFASGTVSPPTTPVRSLSFLPHYNTTIPPSVCLPSCSLAPEDFVAFSLYPPFFFLFSSDGTQFWLLCCVVIPPLQDTYWFNRGVCIEGSSLVLCFFFLPARVPRPALCFVF